MPCVEDCSVYERKVCWARPFLGATPGHSVQANRTTLCATQFIVRLLISPSSESSSQAPMCASSQVLWARWSQENGTARHSYGHDKASSKLNPNLVCTRSYRFETL